MGSMRWRLGRHSNSNGFTLLEVMVAVAVLAVSVVPLLLIRERCYDRAIHTQSLRVARQLAEELLTTITLEVRSGENSGAFEDWDSYTYEYKVTLYDFSGSYIPDEENDFEGSDPYDPNDSVFVNEEDDTFGPMVTRHVEITVFYPSVKTDETDVMNEYVIDTYLPPLMTEEQYERQLDDEEADL